MSGVRWLSDDERRYWVSYLRGSHLLERAVANQLRADADLSHSEYEILTRLSDAPDHRVRMGELAARVVAPKSRLSYQIDQLVARGLVRREPHRTDRRGLDAVITAAGLRLVRRAAPGHLATVREHLVDVLTADQLEALGDMMHAVAEAIRSRDDGE